MESQIHWIVLECVYFWLWKERLKKLILERRVCHLFFLSRWEAGFCNGSKLQFKKKKLIVLIECV